MNKEEKLKELLNKVKETPDNIIEEAIDKLHIEYIKDSKEYIEHEIKTGKLINGYTDIHIFQTEVELLLKYIQHLEQKESILDKVTDLATKIATKIATENAEKYNSKSQKEVDFSEWNLALEILNIIEGENHE